MQSLLLRRLKHNVRLQTWVATGGVLIVFISLAMVYRALTSSTFVHHRHRLHHNTDVERAMSQRVKAKRGNTALDQAYQDFQKDMIFAGLLAREKERIEVRQTWKSDYHDRLMSFLVNLFPNDWTKVPESDEITLELKYLLLDSGLESNMTCKEIDNLLIGGYTQGSKAKMVEYANKFSPKASDNRGQYGSSQPDEPEFVLMSTANNLTFPELCSNKMAESGPCETIGNYKLLRQVLLLNVLNHPGIVQLKGYCLRGRNISPAVRLKGLVIATEVGIPLTMDVLAVCSWSQRVSMALQVAKLLHYLNNNPLGSLRFNKLALRDFVVVRGALLKLADLDDLTPGNLPCKSNSDCVYTMIKKGSECIQGFCKNLNALINQHIVTKNIIKPILQDHKRMPEESLNNMLDVQNFNTGQLVSTLQAMFEKYPPKGPIQYRPVQPTLRGLRVTEPRQWQAENLPRNNPLPFTLKPELFNQDLLVKFDRLSHRNIPGVYDYVCPGSSVSWGCVMTLGNLAEASYACLYVVQCHSFITFSSHPESDKVVTVIFKNGTSSQPMEFKGTTMFVRRSLAVTQAAAVYSFLDADDHVSEKMLSPTSKAQTCARHMAVAYSSLHRTREKKLMAHLGLKGVKELSWKLSASRQSLQGQYKFNKAGSGGQVVIQPDDVSDNSMSSILFMASEGPHDYFTAFALTYQLDRLLGLYHTPPCVIRQLASSDLVPFTDNPVLVDMFKSYISSNGSLTGLLTITAPKQMKTTNLTLEPLTSFTSEVMTFDSINKQQLEYALLIWLSRAKKTDDILSYKDHMIFFNADKSFSNLGTEMSGYLYHCQFPRHVYETLECFRCEPGTLKATFKTQVCLLGEEVVRQTHDMFVSNKEAEFFIHGMTDDNLATVINTAAASVIHLVDDCIQKFGYDIVLY